MTGTGKKAKALVRIFINGRLEKIAWAASRNGSGEWEIQMGTRGKDGKVGKRYFSQSTVIKYYNNIYPGSDVRIQIYK